jgi:hypothetical protein
VRKKIAVTTLRINNAPPNPKALYPKASQKPGLAEKEKRLQASPETRHLRVVA